MKKLADLPKEMDGNCLCLINVIMKKAFWYFLCSLFVVACSSSGGDVPKFNKKVLLGLIISLDDPVDEEWYQFNDDRTVAVTYGKKKSELAAPLFDWRVKDGWLQILSTDGKIFREYFLVEKTPEYLVLKSRNQKSVRFKIIR